MKVADLNKSLIASIERTILHRYSVIYGYDKDIFLMNPKLTFNGHQLTIEDEAGTELQIPGDYSVSVSSNSVIFYSGDKSIVLFAIGFDSLSQYQKIDFDKYYTKQRFKKDIEQASEVSKFNPYINDMLNDFKNSVSVIEGDNPNNRIKFGDYDLLFSITGKDTYNVYEVTEDETEMSICSRNINGLIEQMGEYWSDFYGLEVQR